MYWNLGVIIACLLLLFFLLWREVKRPNKLWLIARLIASLVCVVSIACIALPLTITREQDVHATKEVVLLTDGFNSDSVQTMLDVNKGMQVFTTSKNISGYNAKYITDVMMLADSSSNIKAVHVFGYGIDESELNLLRNMQVVYHANAVTNNITSINWTHKLASGEPLLVQGVDANASTSPVKIILIAFNSNVDSFLVGAKQTSSFQLTTIPKHIDKAVYSLIVLSGKDTIAHEPIPVEVNIVQPLSILLLAASPDFENKFLKNWLAQSEYKLAVRTAISKNKFNKEFVNLSPFSLDRITPSLLEKFDVIIADASELVAMPASDLETIKSFVESNGVGLVIKTDTIISTASFYGKFFSSEQTRDSLQHTIRLNINDTLETAPLKVNQPVYIRSNAALQSLINDEQMHTLVSSKLYGAGKIILTSISNTYTWQLASDTNDYTSYWSLILKKAAKKFLLQQAWSINPSLPQKDEEMHLQLQTANTSIPQAQVTNDIAYMKQDVYLPYQWTATYWPVKTGWQPILAEDGKSTWFYVYGAHDWYGVTAIKKMNANKKYAADHPYAPAADSIIHSTTSTEIPKIYFFIFFMLSAGLLWFEKKFSSYSQK